MKVGEVWCFRCVGVTLFCLILDINLPDYNFYFLDLESGIVRQYWCRQSMFGNEVGEWRRWEA